MSAPPIPPPFEHLGHRPFSFYPVIIGIDHNEWRYVRATWSEVLVLNTKTNEEIWVPRRYLGEISKIEEPMMIWGLTREMEYKLGVLVPHVRRIIEMPKAVKDHSRTSSDQGQEESKPAPIVGIRLESGAESRISKLIGITLVISITATAIFIGVHRSLSSGENVTIKPILQSSMGLTAKDDYFAVVRVLGEPQEDRWRDSVGEIQYRLLKYPDKNVILMGRDRKDVIYIGALDQNWKVIDSVELPGGKPTYAMLANLPRF